MRRRRFERCIVRASAALDAAAFGDDAHEVLDDARQALEEARQLSPDDPDVAAVALRLKAAESPPAAASPSSVVTPAFLRICTAPEAPAVSATPAVIDSLVILEPEPARDTPLRRDLAVPDLPLALGGGQVADVSSPPRSLGKALAVAACLIALCGGGAWLATRAIVVPAVSSAALPGTVTPPAPATAPGPTPAAPPIDAAPVPVSEAQPQPETEPAAVPSGTMGTAEALPSTTAFVTRSEPIAPAASRDGGAAPAIEATETSRATTEDVAPPPVGVPAVVPLQPSALPPAPVQPAPLLPEATPAPSANANAAAPTASRVAAPTSVPNAAAETAAAMAAAVADERLVRGALARYETAYNRLDAEAARAVWPSVDQRALTRAFEGLSAQTVSLGQCDVRLAGGVAQAECAGTAQWTPKVGGGSQNAARRWRFDLKNEGGDWIIVRASVR
jgi:hypothetical protein